VKREERYEIIPSNNEMILCQKTERELGAMERNNPEK